jgi:purine-binding chemotaxis protein CheW
MSMGVATMETTRLEGPAATEAKAAERLLVTFRLAEQACGIDVLAVRDVLGEQPITRMPLAPPDIAGSLNLRGRIVTAIDLRARLGLPDAPSGCPAFRSVQDHPQAIQVPQ